MQSINAPPTSDLPRRMLPPDEVAVRFATWLRDEGYTGWHLATDIPDALQQFCTQAALVRPATDMFLAAFAKAPGVEQHRMRLAGVTDVVLKALRRRAKSDRPGLYRVLEDAELAALARPQAVAAGKKAGKPARARSRATAAPERLAA